MTPVNTCSSPRYCSSSQLFHTQPQRGNIYHGNLLQGSCIQCEGRDDAGIYRHIRSAMELFFSESRRQDILKLLAAMLHLGNIGFEGEPSQTHPGILILGGKQTILMSASSRGTRHHAGEPGNLSRQQIETLQRCSVTAGGELFFTVCFGHLTRLCP